MSPLPPRVRSAAPWLVPVAGYLAAGAHSGPEWGLSTGLGLLVVPLLMPLRPTPRLLAAALGVVLLGAAGFRPGGWLLSPFDWQTARLARGGCPGLLQDAVHVAAKASLLLAAVELLPAPPFALGRRLGRGWRRRRGPFLADAASVRTGLWTGAGLAAAALLVPGAVPLLLPAGLAAGHALATRERLLAVPPSPGRPGLRSDLHAAWRELGERRRRVATR